jgi:uncharacterized protein (DUF58 family)
MSAAADLRGRAEALAAPLPPLLASAEHLAAAVLLGEHGRRRAGLGDAFWQFRAATPADEARMIDWRRSARSDQHFVREKEWQTAQTVQLWVDDAASMRFTGARDRPAKGDRARLIALALAVLLIRGGERVALLDPPIRPGRGQAQLLRLAEALASAGGAGGGSADYGAPEARDVPAHARAVFLSDFLGDPAPVEAQVAKAADRGVRGALLMVLDPQEADYPFDGRTIFLSMGGAIAYETLQAGALRGRYLARLAERKDRLAACARANGWQFSVHRTGESALPALLWLYRALERAA